MTADYADIRFLPTCSKCGSVLWGEEIAVETQFLEVDCGNVSITNTVKYPVYQIVPCGCMKCGALFKTVAIPAKLPFVAPNKPNWKGGGEDG